MEALKQTLNRVTRDYLRQARFSCSKTTVSPPSAGPTTNPNNPVNTAQIRMGQILPTRLLEHKNRKRFPAWDALKSNGVNE